MFFVIYDDKKKNTVKLKKEKDGGSYIPITEKERRKLYDNGYINHIISDGKIIFSKYKPAEIEIKNKRLNEIKAELLRVDQRVMRAVEDALIKADYKAIQEIHAEKEVLREELRTMAKTENNKVKAAIEEFLK